MDGISLVAIISAVSGETVFTLSDMIGAILTTSAIITAVSAIVAVIVKVVGKVKAPNIRQDEKIIELEKRMDKVEERLNSYDGKFARLFKSNKIIMRSLLALTEHSINGNNIDSLRKTRSGLTDYLTTINHLDHDEE